MLVGTYTEALPAPGGHGEGVYEVAVREGRLGPAKRVARAINPAWLVASRDGTRIFASREVPADGAVVVFHVSSDGQVAPDASVRLEPIADVPTGGGYPAHLAPDPVGDRLVVANYATGSVAVFAVTSASPELRPLGRADLTGSSVHPVRQTGPHPHQIVFDPVTGELLVPDLGADVVRRLELSPNGALVELDPLLAEAGSGPRHAVFDEDGSHLFVLGELSSAVTVYTRGRRGFRAVARCETADSAGDGFQASEILAVPGTDLLVVTNRGEDTIAVLRFDAVRRALRRVHTVSSRGRWPRAAKLTPDGEQLVVANQASDAVELFRLDRGAGRLEWQDSTAVPSPGALLFVRPSVDLTDRRC